MIVHGDEISVGVGVEGDEVRFLVIVPHKTASRHDPNNNQGIRAVYDIGEQLGQGAFAVVRKAVERNTGDIYAVKIIAKNRVTTGVAVEREIQILRQLNHPNVAGLKDFYEDNKSYYLVMDYVGGGDLMDFVVQNGAIPEDASREIIKQVLKAVEYVHGLGISHRDLKPDNILIAQDNPVVIKVSDFGLAKIHRSGSFLKTFCGTLAYLAPEVMNSRDQRLPPSYSNLVDIWSIGCLAYVILTGYMPFDYTTQEQLQKAVKHGRYNMEPLRNVNLSQNGLDFIASLLQVNPQQRPSASQALKLSWIVETEDSDSQQSASSYQQQQHQEQGQIPVIQEEEEEDEDEAEKEDKKLEHDDIMDVENVEPSIELDVGNAEGQSSYKEELPISTLKIHSSSAVHEKKLQEEEDIENEQRQLPNISSVPVLDESDSDSDSQEVRHHAELELSQRSQQLPYTIDPQSSIQIETSFGNGNRTRHNAGLHGVPSSPIRAAVGYPYQSGVRDLDSIGGQIDYPLGTWMKLATVPESIPFQDIYIPLSKFTIGRSGPHIIVNDVAISDLRISKRHCEIYKQPHGNGSQLMEEVWLLDNSTNGCYLNGNKIGKGNKILIQDGDTLSLFVDSEENTGSKYLSGNSGLSRSRSML